MYTKHLLALLVLAIATLAYCLWTPAPITELNQEPTWAEYVQERQALQDACIAGDEKACETLEPAPKDACAQTFNSIPALKDFETRVQANQVLSYTWESELEVCLIENKTKKSVVCRAITPAQSKALERDCGF